MNTYGSSVKFYEMKEVSRQRYRKPGTLSTYSRSDSAPSFITGDVSIYPPGKMPTNLVYDGSMAFETETRVTKISLPSPFLFTGKMPALGKVNSSRIQRRLSFKPSRQNRTIGDISSDDNDSVYEDTVAWIELVPRPNFRIGASGLLNLDYSGNWTNLNDYIESRRGPIHSSDGYEYLYDDDLVLYN
ncbi:uncharacterized protein LOC136026559 isoform X2 [Artemia franciscana]|uniref:Uncharacterized protein n=2 Tax=Artemia franciscana TaxID=6661 RepID=A0AA88LE97_ARTSF|nr:hypothetical protein QYM36_007985 [Artemia franciscana]KAK2727333.1 hypothetical protein QYM36_007985 [Artemia franciscana]